MSEKIMVTVSMPNKKFEGSRLGVQFKDGVAQCDAQTAKELKALYGYKIVETLPTKENKPKTEGGK